MATEPVRELSNLELVQELLASHTFLSRLNDTDLPDEMPKRMCEAVEGVSEELSRELNRRFPMEDA